MADLEALAASPTGDETRFALDAGVPGGLRIGDYVTSRGGEFHATLRNTWTEGYRSAYVTGEIWKGFDEVWVQPAYVPVTGFDDRGSPNQVGDNPIFSVGPGSAFYSPFWRIFYFQVPPGMSASAFKSSRDVIDAGVPLIEGPNRTMSLVPGDILLPSAVRPEDPTQLIGGPTMVESGYLDGHEAKYIDFGESNFSWNDDLVVEETPLFVLFYRTASGDLAPLNAPTVAGTGPLFANRPPNVVGNVPHYGAYWRIYTVIVPSTARIFAPPDILPLESARFEPTMVGDEYTLPTPTPKDISTYVGRVAVNPYAPEGRTTAGCFDNYNLFEEHEQAGCLWLDSQTAIEALIPRAWIQRTDILVTCPFVSYRDAPVPTP